MRPPQRLSTQRSSPPPTSTTIFITAVLCGLCAIVAARDGGTATAPATNAHGDPATLFTRQYNHRNLDGATTTPSNTVSPTQSTSSSASHSGAPRPVRLDFTLSLSAVSRAVVSSTNNCTTLLRLSLACMLGVPLPGVTVFALYDVAEALTVVYSAGDPVNAGTGNCSEVATAPSAGDRRRLLLLGERAVAAAEAREGREGRGSLSREGGGNSGSNSISEVPTRGFEGTGGGDSSTSRREVSDRVIAGARRAVEARRRRAQSQEEGDSGIRDGYTSHYSLDGGDNAGAPAPAKPPRSLSGGSDGGIQLFLRVVVPAPAAYAGPVEDALRSAVVAANNAVLAAMGDPTGSSPVPFPQPSLAGNLSVFLAAVEAESGTPPLLQAPQVIAPPVIVAPGISSPTPSLSASFVNTTDALSPSPGQFPFHGGAGGSPDLGPIIGGAVGGIVGFMCVLGLLEVAIRSLRSRERSRARAKRYTDFRNAKELTRFNNPTAALRMLRSPTGGGGGGGGAPAAGGTAGGTAGTTAQLETGGSSGGSGTPSRPHPHAPASSHGGPSRLAPGTPGSPGTPSSSSASAASLLHLQLFRSPEAHSHRHALAPDVVRRRGGGGGGGSGAANPLAGVVSRGRGDVTAAGTTPSSPAPRGGAEGGGAVPGSGVGLMASPRTGGSADALPYAGVSIVSPDGGGGGSGRKGRGGDAPGGGDASSAIGPRSPSSTSDTESEEGGDPTGARARRRRAVAARQSAGMKQYSHSNPLRRTPRRKKGGGGSGGGPVGFGSSSNEALRQHGVLTGDMLPFAAPTASASEAALGPRSLSGDGEEGGTTTAATGARGKWAPAASGATPGRSGAPAGGGITPVRPSQFVTTPRNASATAPTSKYNMGGGK